MILYVQPVSAASTFLLGEFQDRSGYIKIQPEKMMSDLVTEILVNSGQFKIKEQPKLTADEMKRLYDEKFMNSQIIIAAKQSNNFDNLFGDNVTGVRVNVAMTDAVLGDFVCPEVVKAVGKKTGARYIVQGTVQQLGSAAWVNQETNFAANLLGAITKAFGHVDIGKFNFGKVGIGSKCDLRVIDTSTGEVVWHKIAFAFGKRGYMKHEVVQSGTLERDGEMLYQALNETSKQLAEALLQDVKDGLLTLVD